MVWVLFFKHPVFRIFSIGFLSFDDSFILTNFVSNTFLDLERLSDAKKHIKIMIAQQALQLAYCNSPRKHEREGNCVETKSLFLNLQVMLFLYTLEQVHRLPST